MIEHTIERRAGDKLRAVLDVDLGEALAHIEAPGELRGYRARLEIYAQRIVDDLIEIVQIISQEPENGVVRWFDESLGYGFIRGYDKQDIFVHYRQIAGDGFKSLEKGQHVLFKRRKGKESFEAVDVTLAPDCEL